MLKMIRIEQIHILKNKTIQIELEIDLWEYYKQYITSYDVENIVDVLVHSNGISISAHENNIEKLKKEIINIDEKFNNIRLSEIDQYKLIFNYFGDLIDNNTILKSSLFGVHLLK